MAFWCSGLLLFLTITLLISARPNHNVDTDTMVLTYTETNVEENVPQGNVTDLTLTGSPQRAQYGQSKRKCSDGQVYLRGRCRNITT
jgi:hypothetical protein